MITSLLPAATTLTVAPLQDEVSSPPAHYEIMRYRLSIDAGGDANVRLLTVLQAIGKGSVDAVAMSFNCEGGYEGVQLMSIGVAVVFAHDLNQPFTTMSCELPTTISNFYIAGLQPGSTYDIKNNSDSPNAGVIVSTGTNHTADQAGFLEVFPSC